MTNKANVMDISGEIKLSVLSGLVKVEGSAKYLDDTKQSARTSRVTLSYEASTKFEELSMLHLNHNKIKYTKVFDDDKSATHVVTGITYGAKAVFIFEREVSSDENKTLVEGHMKAVLEKIPSLSAEVKVDAKINSEEKKVTEKLKCKFYGDFILKSNPTTYEHAIQIYHELPTLLGKDCENVVPLKVWLYPLHKLDDRAARMMREISHGMIQEIDRVFESFNKARERCNDLMSGDVSKNVYGIKKRLEEFLRYIDIYNHSFKMKLFSMLPHIRETRDDSAIQALGDLLETHMKGPYCYDALTSWLDENEMEINILHGYFKLLGDVDVMIVPGQLEQLVITEPRLVHLHFNLKTNERVDHQLTGMKLAIEERKSSTTPDKHGDSTMTDSEVIHWFRNEDLRSSIWDDVQAFSTCRPIHPVKFVTSAMDDNTKVIGTTINYHKDGKLVTTIKGASIKVSIRYSFLHTSNFIPCLEQL